VVRIRAGDSKDTGQKAISTEGRGGGPGRLISEQGRNVKGTNGEKKKQRRVAGTEKRDECKK